MRYKLVLWILAKHVHLTWEPHHGSPEMNNIWGLNHSMIGQETTFDWKQHRGYMINNTDTCESILFTSHIPSMQTSPLWSEQEVPSLTLLDMAKKKSKSSAMQ